MSDNRERRKGWTELHFALNNGKLDEAKELRQKGADINAKSLDEAGETPLHAALMAPAPQLLEAVKWVLSEGANPNVEDNNGMAPMALVRLFSDDVEAKITALLREHGAAELKMPKLPWEK